jgi:hypothetical protein
MPPSNPPEAGALVAIWPLGTPDEAGDQARYVGVKIVAWSSLENCWIFGLGRRLLTALPRRIRRYLLRLPSG